MLSKIDRILLAMHAAVDAGSMTELHSADICVLAYKAYPESFVLRGYPQYPDYKLVSCLLVTMQEGPKYDKRRGFIRKSRPNHFVITACGLDRVKDLHARKCD
jgi:hypothetical protein